MADRSGWERRPGFDLTGMGAVVVGADSTRGAGVVGALTEANARVAAVAAHGVSATVSNAWDVHDPAAIERGMVEAVRSGATILVTALDVPAFAPIGETDRDAYRAIMTFNLDAVYLCCRAFLTALPADTADARIICLTSMFGERGIDNAAAYAAAQGGIHNLVRALAQEVGARNGATVNGIASGWMTDTPGRGPDDIGQNRLMRFVPMRRFGEPNEVGPLAVLLASPAAGYISGQILHVDGGITTHL